MSSRVTRVKKPEEKKEVKKPEGEERRDARNKMIKDLDDVKESGWMLDQDNCKVYLSRNWFSKSKCQDLYDLLLEKCNFKQEQHYDPRFGKEFKVPRMQYYCGDDTTKRHRYRVADKEGQLLNEWVPELRDIRDRVEEETGLHFDSCLLNYYRNGIDYVDYHPDAEVTPPYNAVFTLSLGTTRKFYMRHMRRFAKDENFNGEEYNDIQIKLHEGNAVLMLYDTQKHWKHKVPVEKTVKDGRISITFRLLK